MKKKKVAIITIIVIAGILVLTFFNEYDTSISKINEYKEEIQNLTTQVEELEQQIEWLKGDLTGCEDSRLEYKEYYDKNCDVNESAFGWTD